MPDKSRGLYDKFTVTRKDGQSLHGGKHEGCDYFVLDLTHDTHARTAALAYANSCAARGHRLLPDDIVRLVRVCRELADERERAERETDDRIAREEPHAQ